MKLRPFTDLGAILTGIFLFGGLASSSGQVAVPASLAVPASAVNTNAPGFKIQTVQFEPSVLGGIINYYEEGLEGMLNGTLINPATKKAPANVASSFNLGIDGYFTWPGVINFDIGGNTSMDGNFNTPTYPDANFPGIPGIGTDKTEIFACRMLTYLFLPKGVTTFGVNSDDDFLMTIGVGAKPLDGFAVRVGSYFGGRGASDSTFTISIQQAGYYAMRLDYHQGTGPASCEFFTVSNGQKILVNDRNKTGAILAYQWQSVAGPAHATAVYPAPNFIGAHPGLISITLQDESTTVATNSIRLSLNGASVIPAISKSGGTTTITFLPSPIFASGSKNSASLVFADNASTQFTNSWSFVVRNYFVLPTSYALTPTSVDRSQPGFWARPYETANATQPNSIAWTEEQLKGLHGPNLADLSGANANGLYVVPTVINFDLPGSHDGYFQRTDYPDAVMPGFPGRGGESGFNSGTEEFLTYLEFPSAGLITIGVTSDDGFKCSTGASLAETPSAFTLGIYDGGRAAAETAFSFIVPQAGVYPFRLLWENAGASMSCEWYTILPDGTRQLINDTTNVVKAWRALVPPNTPPTISAQPQSQTVTAGTAVVFSVMATGSPALTYQWQKNGVNVIGATNINYMINNVQLFDAGSFSVVVRNSAGSIVSAPASLSVILSPSAAKLKLKLISGLPELSIDGLVGTTYRIDLSTNLSNTNWTALLTFSLSATNFMYLDPTSSGSTARFYRVVAPR